jgi:ATP-dependent DNA ligase
VHIKDGKVSAIRNRKNNPVLNLYPEFMALEFEKMNAVLDGELVVFKNNKSVFYGGINQRDKVYTKELLEQFPVTFVAFDILFLHKEVLIGKPYAERLERLNRGFLSHTGKHFMIADSIADPKKYWNDKIIKDGREGLVIKEPDSKYEPSSRTYAWLKLKNYKIAELIVEDIIMNVKGNRVSGKVKIGDDILQIDCQYGGCYGIKKGDKLPVEYLDVVGGKLIQPHKPKNWKQVEVIENVGGSESSKN